MSITSLHRDLFGEIVKYLPIDDIRTLSYTCTELRDILKDSYISNWISHCNLCDTIKSYKEEVPEGIQTLIQSTGVPSLPDINKLREYRKARDTIIIIWESIAQTANPSIPPTLNLNFWSSKNVLDKAREYQQRCKDNNNTLTRLSLYLNNNSLTDITSLGDLTQLEQLYLNNNSLKNITPLKALTQLKKLDLGHNRVTDITPLGDLTQLEQLYLNNNSLKNITPLKALTKLKELDLGHNSLENITPLEALTQLKELFLNHNNSLKNITPLGALIQLERLHLTYNSAINLPLKALTQLKVLYLEDNSVRESFQFNPNG